MLDIEKANANPNKIPEMEPFFDFKRDFDLKDLSPSSHAALSESFLANKQSADLFYKFQVKQSPTLSEPSECDSKC